MEEKIEMFLHRFGGSSVVIDSIAIVEDQEMPLVHHPTMKYGRSPSILTIPVSLLLI